MSNHAGKNQFFIDWISAVIPIGFLSVHVGQPASLERISELARSLGMGALIVQDKAHFGYSFCYRSRQTGARLMYNPFRPDMGVLVVMTGKNLEQISWKEAVLRLRAVNAKFTRLDLSIDTHDAKLSPRSLKWELDAGAAVTKARKWSFMESDPGTTLYIGKRASEQFMRVYDKAAEQGVDGEAWFRVELEMKGSRANYLAERILGMAADDATAVIRGFCDFPRHAAWNGVMGSVKSAVHVPSDKHVTDTEAWIFGMVLKVFRRLYRSRPQILAEFVNEVKKP